jgi:hypothetical protein
MAIVAVVLAITYLISTIFSFSSAGAGFSGLLVYPGTIFTCHVTLSSSFI